MPTTRRNLLKLSAAAVAALALRNIRADDKAAKPLRILILGGTGFIGPHQVRYALARGHKVTLFNRGKQKKEWPGEVEELLGDRNTGDLKALEGREWDVCIDNRRPCRSGCAMPATCCAAKCNSIFLYRRSRCTLPTTNPMRTNLRRC